MPSEYNGNSVKHALMLLLQPSSTGRFAQRKVLGGKQLRASNPKSFRRKKESANTIIVMRLPARAGPVRRASPDPAAPPDPATSRDATPSSISQAVCRVDESAQLGMQPEANSSPKVSAQAGPKLSAQSLNFICGPPESPKQPQPHPAQALPARATTDLQALNSPQTLANSKNTQNFSAWRKSPSLGGQPT